MADLNIDVTEAEAQKSFEILPPGWYIAQIDSSEVKKTKKAIEAETYPTAENQANAKDFYLQLVFKIVEGEAKGRTVWARLNVRNVNETAQKIAEQELAAICDAIKHPRKVKDSVTLHGKDMRIKIDVQAAKEGQAASNVIKGYEAIGNAAKPAVAPAATGGKPAWQS